jgi:hypothetical protein
MRHAALQKAATAFFLAVSLSWTALAAEGGSRQAFIGGLEDLPLMAGLSEDRAAALIFDKPDGRLIDAYAFGPVTPEAVAAFYEETLPQLGWQTVAPLVFEREGERLSIGTQKSEDGVLVRFHLVPR